MSAAARRALTFARSAGGAYLPAPLSQFSRCARSVQRLAYLAFCLASSAVSALATVNLAGTTMVVGATRVSGRGDVNTTRVNGRGDVYTTRVNGRGDVCTLWVNGRGDVCTTRGAT